MFEQSFVRPQSRARTGWTVLVSTGLQMAGITAAVLAPLLSPELLPRVAASIWVAPPGPPPGRAPSTEAAARPSALVRRQAPADLYEPTTIPNRVANIVEPADEPVGTDSGVVGSIPQSGPLSPVLSSIIETANRQPPPERAATEVAAPKQESPIRIVRVSSMEPGMLVERVQPVYPPLAIQLRLEGTVRLRTVVGTDGRIRELIVESGHPILAPAAAAAVRQWRYRPTILNGQPVEIVAPVEVHFKLNR